jgi:hypothetical protein
MAMRYKQYILVLDPKDEDDVVLIKYLKEKHGRKRKNSFSAILRAAINVLKANDERKSDSEEG